MSVSCSSPNSRARIRAVKNGKIQVSTHCIQLSAEASAFASGHRISLVLQLRTQISLPGFSYLNDTVQPLKQTAHLCNGRVRYIVTCHLHREDVEESFSFSLFLVNYLKKKKSCNLSIVLKNSGRVLKEISARCMCT